jgi:LacI family transcriptional regulator
MKSKIRKYMTKLTIKQIADMAGVSRATVDRVLHGRPNVSLDKLERVKDILTKYDYTPDLAARALASKHQELKLGVLLPYWTGFYEYEVMRGIDKATRELRTLGIDVIVRKCETDRSAEAVYKITELEEAGVVGLAICAKNTDVISDKLAKLSSDGISIVTFNTDIPDSKRVYFVGQDPHRSGRIAGELMNKVYRNDGDILIICGDLEYAAHKARVDGFRTVIENRGVGGGKLCVVETANDNKLTYDAVMDWLDKTADPGGIYMANEGVEGCIEALRKRERVGIGVDMNRVDIERMLNIDSMVDMDSVTDIDSMIDIDKMNITNDMGANGNHLGHNSDRTSHRYSESMRTAQMYDRLTIPVVCHDLTDYNREFLKRGDVEFVIDQNMYRQGEEPLLILRDIVMLDKYPHIEERYIDERIICSENL